jgi:hypothetical protein
MKAKRCKPSRGCAAPGPFTAAQRQKLPPEAYALPLELPGKYPLYKWSGGCLLPSKSHAQAAKARARQQFNSQDQSASGQRDSPVQAGEKFTVPSRCEGP